ncbi:MAG TPA: hypothetical protein VGA61_09585 [Anaerolineae bacterium]
MFGKLANLFGRKPAAGPAANAAPPAAQAENPKPQAAAPPCAAELPANAMLAKIIAGRAIQSVTQEDARATVTFSDGSVMKIKTGAPVPVEALTGKTVKDVGQDGVCLDLLFQDGAKARIILAEQASSVLLRDGQGTFEYAD